MNGGITGLIDREIDRTIVREKESESKRRPRIDSFPDPE